MSQEVQMGGEKFREGTSCRVKKLTQEEINLERKPPMDQNTYKGGYNREERTSQEE